MSQDEEEAKKDKQPAKQSPKSKQEPIKVESSPKERRKETSFSQDKLTKEVPESNIFPSLVASLKQMSNNAASPAM